MTSTKRILLYGFYGIENAGNEAMLLSLLEPLRRRFGNDLHVVVASRHPNASYDEQYNVRSIQNLEHSSRDAAKGRWLRGFNVDDSEHYLRLLAEIAAADLVVIGPGQFLVETGATGLLRGSLAQFSAVVNACTMTGTTIMGMALSCEQLRSPWAKLQIATLLPRLDHLSFRDPRSVQNLLDAGVPVPTHEVLGDLALSGPAAPAHHGARLLAREGIPVKKGPRLAFAPRRAYWLDADAEEALFDRMAQVLGAWLANTDRDIVSIPQSTYSIDGGRDDDRIVARHILDRVRADVSDRIHTVDGEYDPLSTEAVYGHADVTLSMRLHGAVLSCKQGTPPIVLGVLDKVQGFFGRLGRLQHVIPVDMPPEEISRRLEEILKAHTAESEALLQAVDAVRATADAYAIRAIRLLEGADGDDPRKKLARTLLLAKDEEMNDATMAVVQ